MKAAVLSVWAFLVVSAFVDIALVDKHRKLLQQWQVADVSRQQIEREYSRLLIEKNALSAHSRIEKKAKKTLHMSEPETLQVIQ